MYNDYPTVFETNIDQTFIYIIIACILLVALLVFTLISVSKVYKKANRSGISAIIPFYNIKVLLEIVNLPSYYFILMLIPIVNIFIYVRVCFLLVKFFRRSDSFAWGLAFLPFIFYPLLAFSKSEYIGINIVAMEEKSTVVEVPVIVEENPELTVHDKLDEGSKQLNISIGGGVYQNDYTKELLDVDNKQTIYKSQPQGKQVKPNIDPSKLTFVPYIEEEVVEEPSDTNTEFQNQMYDVKPVDVVESNISNSVDYTETKTQVESLASEVFGDTKTEETKISLVKPLVQPIEKQDSEFITCPKCGAQMKSSVRTCFLCGNSLD